MNPQTFIFIGRSGSGKGSQVKLLQEYIQKNDSHEHPLFHLETGARFREFIKGESHSSKLAYDVYMQGERQPDFLAIWMWSHLFVENLKGDEHIIIDGTPRSLAEAKVLDTAISFYKRQKPFVIFLNVSRAWSEKHLLSRARSDDSVAEIKKRLDWFERDVQPAVDFYKSDQSIVFLDINGEQPLEKVHQDIIAALPKA